MNLQRQEAESEFGWLGFLRFACALMCIAGFSSAHFHLAYEGVFGWFMVSGYVVTRQLQSHYQPMTHRSIMHFFMDRFLSLYPLYWIVLCLGALMAIFYPVISQMMFTHYAYISPLSFEGALAWFSNITLVGRHYVLGGWPRHSFLPIAWLLSILALFWLMTPTLLKYRAVRMLAVFFGVSFAVFLYLFKRSGGIYADWHVLAYSSMVFVILPYIAGMYVWLWRDSLRRHFNGYLAFVAILLFGGLIVFQRTLFFLPELDGLYVSQVLFFIILAWVSHTDINGYAYWVRSMDRFLSGVSYPMLLLCIPVNTFLFAMYPEWMTQNNEIKYWVEHSFYVTRLNIFFSLAGSVMLYFSVGMPIAYLRGKLRARLVN